MPSIKFPQLEIKFENVLFWEPLYCLLDIILGVFESFEDFYAIFGVKFIVRIELNSLKAPILSLFVFR
jgi:hypothetical protein